MAEPPIRMDRLNPQQLLEAARQRNTDSGGRFAALWRKKLTLFSFFAVFVLGILIGKLDIDLSGKNREILSWRKPGKWEYAVPEFAIANRKTTAEVKLPEWKKFTPTESAALEREWTSQKWENLDFVQISKIEAHVFESGVSFYQFFQGWIVEGDVTKLVRREGYDSQKAAIWDLWEYKGDKAWTPLDTATSSIVENSFMTGQATAEVKLPKGGQMVVSFDYSGALRLPKHCAVVGKSDHCKSLRRRTVL